MWPCCQREEREQLLSLDFVPLAIHLLLALSRAETRLLRWTAEITCHKDFTSYGDKTTASGSPCVFAFAALPSESSRCARRYECCPNSPGPYHSHDDTNNLDESQLGGCALGIAGAFPIVSYRSQRFC